MYKFFLDKYMHHFEKPAIIRDDEKKSMLIIPVTILFGLNEFYKKRKKTIKTELINDYDLTEEQYEYLKKISTNRVFYGAEWGEFQKIYSTEVGTHIPHYSWNLKIDCTIAIIKDFNKNELRYQLRNNTNHNIIESKPTQFENIENVYYLSKEYLLENPDLV